MTVETPRSRLKANMEDRKKYAWCPNSYSSSVVAVYDQKEAWGRYSADVTCGECDRTYLTNKPPKPKK